METDMITYFVKTFIRKQRQDRLLYELTDSKRRYEGLERFCHDAGSLLDRRKIIMEGDDIERLNGFKEFMKKHDGPCMILSDEFCMDRMIPLSEAVALASGCFDAMLILGEHYALVFSETMKGGREKYLLYSEY